MQVPKLLGTKHQPLDAAAHAPPATRPARSLLLGALWLQERKRINAWRAAALGLPPLTGGPMPVIEGAGGAIPIVLMCTHHIVPGMRRPPDYPPFVQVGARAAGGRAGGPCADPPSPRASAALVPLVQRPLPLSGPASHSEPHPGSIIAAAPPPRRSSRGLPGRCPPRRRTSTPP